MDVSLIIAPVLHEYIRGLALEADVEFEEGFDKAKDDGIEYTRDINRASKILQEMKKEQGMPTEEPVKMQPEQEEPMVEPEDMPPAPQGLMARRV